MFCKDGDVTVAHGAKIRVAFGTQKRCAARGVAQNTNFQNMIAHFDLLDKILKRAYTVVPDRKRRCSRSGYDRVRSRRRSCCSGESILFRGEGGLDHPFAMAAGAGSAAAPALGWVVIISGGDLAASTWLHGCFNNVVFESEREAGKAVDMLRILYAHNFDEDMARDLYVLVEPVTLQPVKASAFALSSGWTEETARVLGCSAGCGQAMLLWRSMEDPATQIGQRYNKRKEFRAAERKRKIEMQEENIKRMQETLAELKEADVEEDEERHV